MNRSIKLMRRLSRPLASPPPCSLALPSANLAATASYVPSSASNVMTDGDIVVADMRREIQAGITVFRQERTSVVERVEVAKATSAG